MERISELLQLRENLRSARSAGLEVGFVPTMGALHAGHLSLIREARKRTGLVVASIFVNPSQFGPGEDFSRYPRTVEEDAAMLAEAGCDLLYLPRVEEIYPPGSCSVVRVEPLGSLWCGAARPGHFQGVATVVSILFHQVEPDVAFFGLKDYQQFTILRRMVRDLSMDVEMVGLPTVREGDGLAMSSRNRYLSGEDRQRAGALNQALLAAENAFRQGERNAQTLEQIARDVLYRAGIHRVDYVALVDAESLVQLSDRVGESHPVMLIAAHVGPARLIDNRAFGPF